jgi:hypothetical protein
VMITITRGNIQSIQSHVIDSNDTASHHLVYLENHVCKCSLTIITIIDR